MCGIAGILTTRPDLDLDAPLASMRDALRHRGPDDEGSAQIALPGGARLGLVQTRLAIIDLSPGGHQPMHDPESGSCMIFNGEVYNHQAVRRQLTDVAFRSTSDTETILKGWVRDGDRVLSSLRGMFAFALYDARRGQCWLVRDRLGIKPLYVTQADARTWLFASELRALLASGLVDRRLHAAAVDSYLAFGAVTAPWTLLQGVESLLPGEWWRFDLDPAADEYRPERRRYWRPPFAPAGAPPVPREEAIEQLRPVLLEAAALRMVADVPVGVFLSGGIDSSSVVAALAAQGHALRSFAVVFGERHWDESAHSRAVAERFGAKHTELLLRPEQVLDDLPLALAAYDQPSIDGVNTYFISRTTRQAGLKVALSGIGGDELFAGYSYFRLLARLERGLSRGLARLAYAGLRCVAPNSTRTTKLGAVLARNGTRVAKYAVCRRVLSPAWGRALFPGSDVGVPLPPAVRADLEAAAGGLDAVNAQSLMELSLYMSNMLLRDMDQMSMAHALELREPLLDHVLVETVARLPGPLKLAPGRHGDSKALLVDALPAELPPSILNRPKMGFVFPWERWLRGELRDFAADVFTDADAVESAGFEREAVGRLWADFQASRPGVRYSDILCVLHLLHWVRLHRLAVAEPAVAGQGD